MKNQFFYTRKTETGDFLDSFNINKVIRSLTQEDGKLLVLLDDLHERVEQVPVYNPKTGQVKEFRRERNTYQSEIMLEKEDAEKFKSITEL